ncbi:unnamed protein product [Bursaphelenchus okinawaensis]|uniref:Uncharacterized protein n=1 Tax=Bursaphelenchus okinawaensis TaxID=465554 RepID=A0A811KE07_9BILA|nr:unnamed protein product [Bursaphelenchus okinawaensis]CAG9099143.1 unnamed protein product [Bursaphelenchus okinawaensis]
MSYGGSVAGYRNSGADEKQRYGNGTTYSTGVKVPSVYDNRPPLEYGINTPIGYGKPLLPPPELNGASGYGNPFPPGINAASGYGNPPPPRMNAASEYGNPPPPGFNCTSGRGNPFLPQPGSNCAHGYGKPLQSPPGFSDQSRYGNSVLMSPRISAPYVYNLTASIPSRGNAPPGFNGHAPPPFGNNAPATVNNGSASVNNGSATVKNGSDTVNNPSYGRGGACVPSIYNAYMPPPTALNAFQVNNNECRIASCTYGTSQMGHNGAPLRQTNGSEFVNHCRAGLDNLNAGNQKQLNLNSTEPDNRFNGEGGRQNVNAEDSQKDNKADDRFNLLFGDESRFQALCSKDHYQVYQSQMEVIKSFYKKALSNLKDNQFTSPEFDEIFFNLKMISRDGKLDNYILKRMKEVKTRTFYYANDIFGFCKLLQAYTDQRFLEDETEDSDDSFSNLNHQDESTFSMYGPDDERYNSTFEDAVKWEAECDPEHLEVYRRQVEILRRFYKLCRIALVKKEYAMELEEFDLTVWAAIGYAKSGDLDNYMVKALKRVLNDKCRNDAKLLEACYALVAYNSLKYLEEESRPNVRVSQYHEEAAPSFETNQNTEGLVSAINCQQHTSESERPQRLTQQFHEAVNSATKLMCEDSEGLSKDLKALSIECSEEPEAKFVDPHNQQEFNEESGFSIVNEANEIQNTSTRNTESLKEEVIKKLSTLKRIMEGINGLRDEAMAIKEEVLNIVKGLSK